jgi:hypothetical protein
MANEREVPPMNRPAMILADANPFDLETSSGTETSPPYYVLEGWNYEFGGLRPFESIKG